jgi:hypothetical protein
MTKLRFSWTLLLALGSGACDEAPEAKPLPTFSEDDAGDKGGAAEEDAGGGDEEGRADGGSPRSEREGPQFGVISSDWTATSISLLGLDGSVLADDYVNSGSVQAGLVTALSGDVELPTHSGEQGVLVLIDRYKTDVITRIRLADAKVLGQVKTHTPPSQATENAFSSNPQDYLRVDDETAWVTRDQPNLDPGVDEIDLGNDLLRINPSTMERTDERIDLSVLDTTAIRANFDTGMEEVVRIYARPSRMARVGGTLIVGLGMSAFDFSALGPGTVAVVDLAGKSVEGLALEGLSSCTKAAPIPGERERVLVSCGGDQTKTTSTAGFAIVRVRDGKASVELAWHAAQHSHLPVLSSSSVALGGTLIAAAAYEYSRAEPSVFGLLDLATSEYTELLTIPAGAGTFGTPLYDADARLLLVPDASTDADMRPSAGIHVFTRHGADFEETGSIDVAKGTTLPVRHVYPL